MPRLRLGVTTDERTIPHEVGWIGGPGAGAVHLNKGCYRARVHNLQTPDAGVAASGRVSAAAVDGDAVLAGGRTVGRLGTVVEHVELSRWHWPRQRGPPAALVTGPEAEAAAVTTPTAAARR